MEKTKTKVDLVNGSNKINVDLKKYGMFLVLIALFLLFFFFTKGANFTPANINNLILQNGYVVIMAVGMLLCVLTGNVDLGVGSVVAFTGATVGTILMDMKTALPNETVRIVIAIVAAIAIGLACGGFAGFFISVLKVPPFIVTLATMLMGRGATYVMLQAKTKGPLPNAFNYIGAGYLPTINATIMGQKLDLLCIIVAIIATVFIIFLEMRDLQTKRKYHFSENPMWQIILKDGIIIAIVWFIMYKLACYHGIPFVLVIMGLIVAIYNFITSSTVSGRQIYAVGGNRKAASLSGIDTDKVFFWVYTNMGFLAAIAGIVLAARMGSATPKAGDGYEMDAIASCYIGGAAVAGGSGTIMGAVVGAFIMGVLNNGMILFGLSTDIQKIVKGAVLLIAVTADLLSKRKKG